jgi:acetyltransferase-like isoleucine patch superfamily enzyme
MTLKQFIKENRFLCRIVYGIQNHHEKRGFIIGKGNSIYIQGVRISTKFKIKGKNNAVKIDRHALVNNSCIVIMGNNSFIHIKEGARISGATLWVEDDGCILEIGRNTFVGPSHLAVTEDGSSLTIGDDCMLSSNINIRTGDSHSIIDIETNQRINYAKNISIGNHCWIGEGAKILKGVNLVENCIVSTGAIVTKSFAANCLVGGTPAKIIRENVNWNKERL